MLLDRFIAFYLLLIINTTSFPGLIVNCAYQVSRAACLRLGTELETSMGDVTLGRAARTFSDEADYNSIYENKRLNVHKVSTEYISTNVLS